MRDRLIELLTNMYLPIKVRNSLGSYDTVGGLRFGEIEINGIANHLLANGVIVPPVSVGQTVYRKYWNGGFVKCTVSMITQKADKSFKIRLSYNGSVGDYTEDDFGKTVFLTKEEAEAALAERSGE